MTWRSARIFSFNPAGACNCLSRSRIAIWKAQCCSNQHSNSGSRRDCSRACANSGSFASSVPGRKRSNISLAWRLSMGFPLGCRGCRIALSQYLLQLRDPARNTRFHCAQRDGEDVGNFLVGMVLEIKKRQGRLKRLVQLRQRLQPRGRVQFIDGGGGDGGQLLMRRAEFEMGKAVLPPLLLQEFVIQRREQPGLGL